MTSLTLNSVLIFVVRSLFVWATGTYHCRIAVATTLLCVELFSCLCYLFLALYTARLVIFCGYESQLMSSCPQPITEWVEINTTPRPFSLWSPLFSCVGYPVGSIQWSLFILILFLKVILIYSFTNRPVSKINHMNQFLKNVVPKILLELDQLSLNINGMIRMIVQLGSIFSTSSYFFYFITFNSRWLIMSLFLHNSFTIWSMAAFHAENNGEKERDTSELSDVTYGVQHSTEPMPLRSHRWFSFRHDIRLHEQMQQSPLQLW